RPFSGDSVLATALLRLKEAPVSPCAFVPDLDRRWETAILACLERDPGSRPGRAEEVVELLSGALRPARRALWRAPARRWGAAVPGAIVLFSAASIVQRQRPSVALPEVDAHSRRSIALLGFRNLSGQAETAWLSTALAETLGMELASGEKLRIVPGEEVARTKRDLKLNDVDGLARDTLARVRLRMGSDLVVLGSYLELSKDASRHIRL